MTQVYAYYAASSEIIARAGSLAELLKKLNRSPDDHQWLVQHLGTPHTEPLYFYKKDDIHGDDEDCTQISLAKVVKEAKKLGILT